jgi:hypothetical protein
MLAPSTHPFRVRIQITLAGIRLGVEGRDRGRSSVGRATALQAVGRRFDPDRLHHDWWFGSLDMGYVVWEAGFGLVAQLVRARA